MNDSTASAAARIGDQFAADRYAALLGIELVEADPERVQVALTLTDNHLNFLGGTHGGALFSLADCALSLASNAHGTPAVAIDAHLVLTSGSTAGDRLVAVAEPMTRGTRVATYRITITRGDGRICGLFTGTVQHLT